MTGRHRAVGRHRACRKRVSMWPRLGFIGAVVMATAGPALIFSVAVGPEAFAAPPVLSSAITTSAPVAAATVLAVPARGGFYIAQPRVDLMVRQVYAAINPTHDAANGGGGGGSEGGSHHTSTHDSHDTGSHDTGSHDHSSDSTSHEHHGRTDTGSDTPSQPPGCH